MTRTGGVPAVSVPDSFAVLGGPPYEDSANQTSLQMFQGLSPRAPKIYVARRTQEAVRPFSSATPTSIKRGALPNGLHQVDDCRWVLVLPSVVDDIPLVRPECARRLASTIIGKEVWRAVAAIGVRRPALVAYWWMIPELCADPRWATRIFDVVGRHWGYNHLGEAAASRNRDFAYATANACDDTLCASESLASEFGNLGVSAQVVPNGVDLIRVARAESRTASLDRGRTAVYVGGWESRVDLGLVRSIVERNPDWQFVLAGGPETGAFRAFSNVETYGDVDYDTALMIILSSRVGIVPFQRTEFTGASNFLKVLDYLACGLSVIAMDMPSMRGIRDAHPGAIHLADSAEAWNDVLGKLSPATALPTRDAAFAATYGVAARINAFAARLGLGATRGDHGG